MTTLLYYTLLFIAKVFDNGFGTAKTILIQRNRCVLAGISLACSNLIYYYIVKSVVSSAGSAAIVVVSVASGVGCCLAVVVSNRFSKDRTYVNVIMSDDIAAMRALRDYLARQHVTNVATDSYTMDWSRKTITITAYAETRRDSRLIDEYILGSPIKFKRVIRT